MTEVIYTEQPADDRIMRLTIDVSVGLVVDSVETAIAVAQRHIRDRLLEEADRLKTEEPA